MNKTYELVELEQAAALPWLRHSLGQGEVFSPATLETIERCDGRSYAILPGDLKPKLNLDFDGILGLDGGPANRAMAKVLEDASTRDAGCVVIEDEMSEKGDPNPSWGGRLLTAFVGRNVIHWAGLGPDGGDAAVAALNAGSTGYPLNAFVTSSSADELGLVDGAELDSDVVSAVVNSMVAVIVGAYDGVSFVIWERICRESSQAVFGNMSKP
ncbi:MAG TPA: hypothetical protein VG147_01235 [Solirubrobacteraceae bacterium]|jgi:hypothetical protein|nr:hypothetical protein [Solirubrobacteraceae bacterium]